MSTRPDGQAGYVPKLRYRNAVPLEMAEPSDETKEVSSPPRILPTSSGREIRESLPRSSTTMTSQPFMSQPPQQKKKGSLFGGLFVKEPSMAALDMVAAQMIDRHGKISPTTMPYVSSAKMPQHVPKVNSRWDGVPDAVKIKEKEQKMRDRERPRAATRNPVLPGYNNMSRSTDGSGHNLARRRLSNADSWDSRSSGSRPTFQDNNPRPDSLYSSDSGGSDRHLQRQPSWTSQSYTSPSGTSLPDITAFFPKDISIPPRVPQGYTSSNSSTTYNTGYSERTGPERPRSDVSTILTEPIPEHSASPLTTPVDESPRTPVLISDDETMDTAARRRGVIAPTQLTIPTTPAKGNRVSMQPIDAFLAGEARPVEIPDDHDDYRTVHQLPLRAKNSTSRYSQAGPIGIVQQDLEKRPDSSRARLGLRASMIVPTGGAPWESHSAGLATPQSPKSPTSTRAKFRLFTKDRP